MLTEPWQDKDYLRQLYVENNLSCSEIAEMQDFDCCERTVNRWVNKFGFETGIMSSDEKQDVEITTRQHELIKGTLLGDAYINRGGPNPRYILSLSSEKFLQFLNSELTPITTSVRLEKTGDELKEQASFSNEDSSFQDRYTLGGRSLPQLQQYADWYVDGDKTFPNDIELTSTIIEAWYVCDGSLIPADGNRRHRFRIHNTCFRKDEDKVSQAFDNVGIDISWHTNGIYISADDSEWLGERFEGFPGFEYKYPNAR